MKFSAKWWAILFCYKEGVLLEFLTPTKIEIDELNRKIVVTKRDYNLITIQSTTFWIKDIRSFEIEKTLIGYSIRIKSRGNNIICKGFSSDDAMRVLDYFNQLK